MASRNAKNTNNCITVFYTDIENIHNKNYGAENRYCTFYCSVRNYPMKYCSCGNTCTLYRPTESLSQPTRVTLK